MRHHQLRKALWLLTTIATLLITPLYKASAQKSMESEMTNITKIENSQLLVVFKNGTKTLRKGSKGLREVKFYKAELIESVAFSTDTATSGVVTKTSTIESILNYILAGDFTTETPFLMTPQDRAKIFPKTVSMTITLFDGREVVRRGYEIVKHSEEVDERSIASMVFDLGNGYVSRTTFAENQNYKIKERLIDGKVNSVELETRKGYILEDGYIIVTFKGGHTNKYESHLIDRVKRIQPTMVERIEVIDNSAPQTTTPKKPETIATTAATAAAPKNKVDFYDLRRDQIMVINRDDFKYGKVVAYLREDCTEVDFIFPIFYSKQWVSNSSESYLVDPNSGEKYKIRGLKGDIPLDRYARIIEQVGHTVVITNIFPPLPKGTKTINLLEYRIEGQPTPAKSNGTGPWLTRDIKVLGDIERAYKDIDVEESAYKDKGIETSATKDMNAKPERLYFSDEVDVEPLFMGNKKWQKSFQKWVNGQLSELKTSSSTTYKPDDIRYPNNISKHYGEYSKNYTTTDYKRVGVFPNYNTVESVEFDKYLEAELKSSKPKSTSVKVLFTVNIYGDVQVTKILSSASKRLAIQAADIVESSSGMWSPATIKGKSVAAVQIVEIDFKR